MSFPRDEATLPPARAEARQDRTIRDGRARRDRRQVNMRCVPAFVLCGLALAPGRAAAGTAGADPAAGGLRGRASLGHRLARQARLRYADEGFADDSPLAGRAGGAGAHAGGVGPRRRVRAVSRARAAHRLQRSARARRHARRVDEPERPAAQRRVQLPRAQSGPHARAEPVVGDGQGKRRVRPSVAGPCACGAGLESGRRRRAGPGRAGARGGPRPGLFPDRGDRGAGRLQGKIRLRFPGRDCRARRSAAQRHRDCSGQDWRSAVP